MAPMVAARLLACGALAPCVLLGASCLPDYGEIPFACAQSSACPEGYRCVSQVCRRGNVPADARLERDGHRPDAAVDAPKLADATLAGDLVAGDLVAKKDVKPTGWTCAQIGACFNACAPGYQPCLDACLAQGSPDGQATMNALVACQLYAAGGACYDPCHNQSQPVCAACLQLVCAAQLAACYP